MDVISLTNPIPPQGTTNTTVPLSITASTAETSSPVNVPIKVTNVYSEMRGVFFDLLTISDTNAIGSRVFQYNYRSLFASKYNLTNSIVEDQVVSGFMPWALILPYFSKFCKMEVDFALNPIKIADSRVRLDIVSTYDRTFDSKYNVNTLANPNMHILLDDPTDTINISMPTYFISNNVSTDAVMAKVIIGGGTITRQIDSSLAPTTLMTSYIASPYQHNSLQMPSFKVLVEAFPRFSNVLGLTAKRYIKVERVINNDDLTRSSYLTPYFL
jgi:hypothetical protein